jgi:pimeloyl-ACP methyl ester carboxylesterase
MRSGLDEVGRMKESYRHPGTLAAALGYYRSFSLALAGIGKQASKSREVLFKKTSVPTLCFAALADGVFGEATFDRTREAFTGPYELVKVNGAGHFLHVEQSQRFFEQRVLEFMRVSDTPAAPA